MKLLVVLSRFPYPLEKGDKLRAYNQIRFLSQHHDIYLFALSDRKVIADNVSELTPFCKAICIARLSIFSQFIQFIRFFFKGLPFQCAYFYSRKNHRKFLQFVDEVKPDHLYCQMVRTVEYTKLVPIKKTLDYQDVLSKGVHRRLKIAPFYLKPFFKMEYRRLKRYETEVFDYFDNKTIITGVDRDLLPHSQNEKIHIIANGVDFSRYLFVNVEKEYDIIFTGNMSYAPNVEAAEFIVKQLFPKLRKEFPSLRLVLCGASPSLRVQALKREGVTVTGWVDSMADYYARSRIFLAPMHIGTGLQNKLLEAMAMKLPCVTSPLAGKPLEGIEEGKEIIICNSAIGYLEAIKLLLTNPEQYEELSENGYHFVKRNYNWETTTHKLIKIIENTD